MKKIVLMLSFVLACAAEEKSALEKMVQPRIAYESTYLGEANVAHTDGGVEVYKNNLRINNELFGVSYSNWKFDWNNIAALPFGDGVHTPIEQIHAFALNINMPKKIDEKWFFLASLSLKSTFEKETEDSYGVNIFSFASYRLDEEHSFSMGAFADYHPTSTFAYPVISYSYREKFKEGWQVVLGFPRTHVGYHINEELLVRFGLMFSQSLVRLADTSPIEKSGYVEVKDYGSNLGLTYRLNKNLTLSGDLLYTLSREFIIYDTDAKKVQNNTIDNAFGVNLRVVYRF